jgi:hypothetical protein
MRSSDGQREATNLIHHHYADGRKHRARLLAKGMEPELARVTPARKIAGTTLTLWKKAERFDAGYFGQVHFCMRPSSHPESCSRISREPHVLAHPTVLNSHGLM